MTNEISAHWFGTFLDSVPAEQTEREVAFLTRQLPLPQFARVLDVCCGAGRHAHALGTRGYRVTGLDSHALALERARSRRTRRVDFVAGDMRRLPAARGAYDAVLCMWQSFGYFDPATNRAVLAGFAAALRPAGRLVLDLYHRAFFEQHQGRRQVSRAGVHVEEDKSVRDGRLTVQLRYDGTDVVDRHEWEVYLPHEIAALAAEAGLTSLLSCRDFDEAQPPSPDMPRMQLVLGCA